VPYGIGWGGLLKGVRPVRAPGLYYLSGRSRRRAGSLPQERWCCVSPGLSIALNLAYRAAAVYFFVLFATRILGKRELGQVSPFDFVVAVMIGEIAVLSVEDTSIALWQAAVPIVVMVVLHIIIAIIALKYDWARAAFSGVPTVVIENGRIIEPSLRELRYNVNDLLANLREKGITNVADVEFAIMECTGKLSVVPKSQCRPLTARDLGIPSGYEGLSLPLVADGRVQPRALEQVGLDEAWLRGELRRQGIDDPREVLLASLDTGGNLYVSRKGESLRDWNRPRPHPRPHPRPRPRGPR